MARLCQPELYDGEHGVPSGLEIHADSASEELRRDAGSLLVGFSRGLYATSASVGRQQCVVAVVLLHVTIAWPIATAVLGRGATRSVFMSMTKSRHGRWRGLSRRQ